MKFKVDENLPGEVAEVLVSAGHDALSIRDQGLGGATDGRVAAVCHAEDRVLITLDVDFADPRAYPVAGSPGIVVFRLRSQNKRHVLECLRRIISHQMERIFRSGLSPLHGLGTLVSRQSC